MSSGKYKYKYKVIFTRFTGEQAAAAAAAAPRGTISVMTACNLPSRAGYYTSYLPWLLGMFLILTDSETKFWSKMSKIVNEKLLLQ